MKMNKREFLTKCGWAAGVIGLPFYIQATAETPETKPLTTAGLARSLLTLADKAERQGMRKEAQAIYQAVKVVLEGTKASVVPCDTDTDCMKKNGGDGYGQ